RRGGAGAAVITGLGWRRAPNRGAVPVDSARPLRQGAHLLAAGGQSVEGAATRRPGRGGATGPGAGCRGRIGGGASRPFGVIAATVSRCRTGRSTPPAANGSDCSVTPGRFALARRSKI